MVQLWDGWLVGVVVVRGEAHLCAFPILVTSSSLACGTCMCVAQPSFRTEIACIVHSPLMSYERKVPVGTWACRVAVRESFGGKVRMGAVSRAVVDPGPV